MRDELLYLPVNSGERDLVRWFRGSRFRADAAQLIELMEAIEGLPGSAEELRSRVAGWADAAQEQKPTERIRRELAELRKEVQVLASRVGSAEPPQPAPALTPPEPPPVVAEQATPGRKRARRRGPGRPPAGGLRPMQLDGHRLQGAKVAELCEDGLRRLVDAGKVTQGKGPYAVRKTGVLIADEPLHLDGRPFRRPREYKGLHIETGMSQKRLHRAFQKLANEIGVEFTVGDGEDELPQGSEPSIEAPAASTSSKRPRKVIPRFVIAGQEVWADRVPDFFRAALEVLVDGGHVQRDRLPAGAGPKRYVLASAPVHPSGKPFVRAVEYQGVFAESHAGKEYAGKVLEKVLNELGVPYRVQPTG